MIMMLLLIALMMMIITITDDYKSAPHIQSQVLSCVKNTATGIGWEGTWWYLGPQVDAMQWPTSADRAGNVRPGWQGRLG